MYISFLLLYVCVVILGEHLVQAFSLSSCVTLLAEIDNQLYAPHAVLKCHHAWPDVD